MRDANATVTAVVAPGGVDEYGDATTGTTAWAGSQDCYLTRPRRTTSRDREQDSRVDMAVLPAAGCEDLLAALRQGDNAVASRVTVVDRRSGGAVTRTYELAGLDVRAAGLSVDSARLTLRREA